jgi:hypothetical protein
MSRRCLEDKRGHPPFAGTARRVLRTIGECPLLSRPGMTLLELLISMSVMLLVVGTLAGLAKGVQLSFEHGEAYGTITQHARVAFERITRTANGARANKHFPGFLVVAESDGTWSFPETLVVWGKATQPGADDVPKVSELVVYCPDRNTPADLVEITIPDNATAMPSLDPTGAGYSSNLATWQATVLAMRQSTSATKVRLTSLLRTAAVGSSGLRGAVRFTLRLTPSDSQLSQYYVAHTRTWQQVSWAQGMYGPDAGLRQAWVRMEIQLQPQTNMDVTDPAGLYSVPFFGSAAIYYAMRP